MWTANTVRKGLMLIPEFHGLADYVRSLTRRTRGIWLLPAGDTAAALTQREPYTEPGPNFRVDNYIQHYRDSDRYPGPHPRLV